MVCEISVNSSYFHILSKDGVSHPASEFDMDKVKGTLKQVVRDWSSDGAAERQQCYQPVIDQIIELFPESEL